MQSCIIWKHMHIPWPNDPIAVLGTHTVPFSANSHALNAPDRLSQRTGLVTCSY